MKKTIIAFISIFLFSFQSNSQEVGYNTADIGAEYNYYKGGSMYNLHVAFNSKLHHSFIIRAGYNSVNNKYADNYNNEKGGGFTAGLGYRYYVLYRPHGFFIGAKADYWKMDLDWTNSLFIGKSETSFFVPAAETGYMLLANDLLFITPTISLGTRINLKSDVDPVKAGLIFQAGISAGIKF